MHHFKYRAALTWVLWFSFFSTAYAQTPAPPLSSIDFVGIRYDLVPQEVEDDFNYGRWHYRPKLQGAQQSRYQELILTWDSDEWISDTFDKDTCPPISENYHKYIKENKNYPFLHIIAYRACYEIYRLRNDSPGVIKTHEDERTGEMLVASIIAGKDEKLGDFVKLTLSRYIPVPIHNYDYIDSALHYSYVITAYGPSQEQAVAFLERPIDQESGQWVNTLLAAPVPQFILDRGKHYKTCKDFYENEEDKCPW